MDAVALGGNAIDAALAAAAVLTVVYPHQCAVGGDLIAVFAQPGGDVQAVVSAGAAAAGIDVDRVRADHERMPGRGPLTVTVPGAVAGWQSLAAAGAALPLGTALQRAANLAEAGFTVSPGMARALQANTELLSADPGMRSVFFSGDGAPLPEGAHVCQPALAATLRRLASNPDDMYSGRTAELLTEGLQTLGSPLQQADFASHRAETVTPVSRTVKGSTWYVAPAPSQGVALLSVLGAGEDWTQAELLERSIRTAEARDRLLADPRFADVDLDGLLAAADGAGTPEPAADSRAPKPAGDTVAVTAVDSDGRAVSIVQSVFQSFGAGLLEPATGIVLHSRGAAFSLNPEHPALLRPGARPPHTLSPALCLSGGESGRTVIALGCQGGRAQPWILAQVASALADPATGDPGEVLQRKRWVFGAADIGATAPTVVVEDDDVAPELASVAARAGFASAARGSVWDEAGHVQVARLQAGVLSAASDPRADGAAAVSPAG